MGLGLLCPVWSNRHLDLDILEAGTVDASGGAVIAMKAGLVWTYSS